MRCHILICKKIIKSFAILQMSEVIPEDIRSPSPGTPPPTEPEDGLSESPRLEDQESFKDIDDPQQGARGKKRHRRAKGKKKKQKTNLMITNEDGTNSTADASASKQKKKVFLRPSAARNPLLMAPKNSTQFIMDDHENSDLFWNFDSSRQNTSKDDIESVGEESNDAKYKEYSIEAASGLGESPDDDSFWDAYLEKDFESVYENAHKEEIYSWNRTRIIEEISTLEKRQKQLIDMLSQIDPMIYLQKLQHELLSLQEENRQLKLVNIAEKLERERRRTGPGSGTSSPRLPDSTTEAVGRRRPGEEAETESEDSSDSDSDTSSESGDSEVSGGCSSGCCLAEPLEDRLREVEEKEEEDVDTGDNGAVKPEETEEKSGQGDNGHDGVPDIDDTSQSCDK